MSSCVLRTVPSPLHSFVLADQPVLQRSEVTLLISAGSAQDIISRCYLHNNNIPWDALTALDTQTKPMAQFTNVTADPLEQFLNLEAFQMRDTATYEPMVQPNDLVNEYDGPVRLHTLVPCGRVC
jgi:hypothetical protein